MYKPLNFLIGFDYGTNIGVKTIYQKSYCTEFDLEKREFIISKDMDGDLVELPEGYKFKKGDIVELKIPSKHYVNTFRIKKLPIYDWEETYTDFNVILLDKMNTLSFNG